jgi:predicted nucleic acid-binding protein
LVFFPAYLKKLRCRAAVQAELSDPLAPPAVRHWIASPPEWLEIHDTTGLPQVSGLDEGETAAVALAKYLDADMLLIDERDGFRVAQRKGLRVTGTLGLLDLAAERGLVDFELAIKKLEHTTTRRPAALLDILLDKHRT